MKKRFVPFVMIMVVLLSVIAGCGQGSQQSKDDGSKESAQTESGGSEDAADESESSAKRISYNYEHELNIIDDNYRNYYEVFVYSFYDSNDDGIGDLDGLTEKLDYISDMGFNGIWVMPIMNSPTYHKYDVVDYKSIDAAYGTMEDFEELIQGCHQRGIRLVIDFVINHTSSQHSWFTEACDYLKGLADGEQPDSGVCPYVDYYHFSREQVDGTWYQVGTSNWYYEGSFWSEMPDLDLSCEGLKEELKDIAAFWIEKGVDGFRMDAAMHYEETDVQANLDTLNWLYEYCKGLNPDFYMVSEVWASLATIASYYESGTPSMFNFDGSSAEGKLAKTVMGSMGAAQFVDALMDYHKQFSEKNPDYIDAPFLTNHDQVRIANNLRCDPALLKMAAGLLMTMNGSPFVYYGEEIGMISKGTKDENKRLPMNWSSTNTKGIPNPPQDADPDVEQTFPPVDEQQADDGSLLNYYKRAVRIRNENPEIARGEISKIESLCDKEKAAITKSWDGSTIGIVYNLSDEEQVIDLSGTAIDGMEIRGYLTLNGEEVTIDAGKLMVPARSICFLK